MIRPIQPDDIEVVVAIYNYYITNTVISFEEAPVSPADMQTRVERVIAAGLPWLVAEQSHEIVGYAYASQWNARSAYKYAVEISVYLSPEATAKGWGTKLYTVLFDELKKHQTHAVIAGIALPNPTSVALHEKFGMEQVSHFREVGFKFNQWVDVGHWYKILPE